MSILHTGTRSLESSYCTLMVKVHIREASGDREQEEDDGIY